MAAAKRCILCCKCCARIIYKIMRRPCVFPATACGACAARPRPQIGAEEKWCKCRRCRRYQSIARRRAHDSQLQRCRIALPSTRVRRHRGRRRKFPAEYTPAAATAALPKHYRPATAGDSGDGRFRPTVRCRDRGGEGMTLARTRGHLISCRFRFCRLEIPLFPLYRHRRRRRQ